MKLWEIVFEFHHRPRVTTENDGAINNKAACNTESVTIHASMREPRQTARWANLKLGEAGRMAIRATSQSLKLRIARTGGQSVLARILCNPILVENRSGLSGLSFALRNRAGAS